MLTPKKFFRQTLLFIHLGLPIFLGQISQMSMAFVDALVAGRYSTVAMAGVAIGGSFWVPLLLFGIGMLNCMLPLIAQGVGQKKTPEELYVYWRQGAWLSMLICIPLFALLVLVSHFILTVEDIEPALALVTSDYLSFMKWGLPGMFLFFITRFYQEAHGQTRPGMLAGIIGLLANIPLNYIFVYGIYVTVDFEMGLGTPPAYFVEPLLAIPEYGGAGCGLASAIVCWVMALVTILYALRDYKGLVKIVAPQWSVIYRMFRIGLPSAVGQMLEVSSFTLISFFIAPLGSVGVAGHQIALNVSSLIFMSPLSLCIVVSIQAATALGAKNHEEAINIRKSAMILAFIFSALVCLLLVLFRHLLPHIYSQDLEVIKVAEYILIFTAIYQVPDWIQMVALGSLRAYNDTKAIFFNCVISYWGVSLPIGYLLCFTDIIMPRIGIAGFWVGLIIGLTTASILLSLRLRYLEKQSMDWVQAKIAR